jgi:gamma-glutamylcyclotransferase (GGCT)/AIG2-like uncharacterized protein YtfP
MTDHSIYHLFVYGSLRSGFHSPAYEYISRYFDLIGKAKVRGKLFDLGEYPAAVPAEDDHFITGELYKIRKEPEFSWAIGQLDDYEGVMPEEGEKALYRRATTEVFMDNRIVKAWVYWYNGNVEGRPLIISGDIMDYLK